MLVASLTAALTATILGCPRVEVRTRRATAAKDLVDVVERARKSKVAPTLGQLIESLDKSKQVVLIQWALIALGAAPIVIAFVYGMCLLENARAPLVFALVPVVIALVTKVWVRDE